MSSGPLIFAAVFNYAVAQAFAWMQVASDRELYDLKVEEIDELERLGVHARRVRVRGQPDAWVRIGSAYEEGWPEAEARHASLRSEAVELVDDDGKIWALDAGVSLAVTGVDGRRERIDPPNEIFDFQLTPERTFYTLMTSQGVFQLARRGVSPSYWFVESIDWLAREATPRGAFGAWILVPLTYGLFWLAERYIPPTQAMLTGLCMLCTSMFVFVCLQGSIFELPFPRFRSKLPARRWLPEVR